MHTYSVKFDAPASSPIKGMTFYLNKRQTSLKDASLDLKKSYLFGHDEQKTEYAKDYLSQMFKNNEIRVNLAEREYSPLVYIDSVFVENPAMIRAVLAILKSNKILNQSASEEIKLIPMWETD